MQEAKDRLRTYWHPYHEALQTVAERSRQLHKKNGALLDPARLGLKRRIILLLLHLLRRHLRRR